MLFSVVVPVYNGSKYLSDAIDSLLGQSNIDRDEFEIIVVNDGSNDEGETRVCAKKYGENIRYFEKENGGVSTALNLGIGQAKGEFICWLSHDDVFCEDKLATQKEAINRLRSDGVEDFVLFSRQRFIGPDGSPVWQKKVNPNETGQIFVYSAEDAFLNLLLGALSVGGCTIAIPRKLFGNKYAGLFVEDFRYIQDRAMWLKMALVGVVFARQDRVLVRSRVHGGQQTGRFQDRLFRESRLFLDWVLANRKSFTIELSDVQLSALCFELGKYRMVSALHDNSSILSDFSSPLMLIKSLGRFSFGFALSYVLKVYRHYTNFRYRKV